MSAYSVVMTMFACARDSGRHASAQPTPNSRHRTLLALTNYFGVTAQQRDQVVKVFPEQPLLRFFSLFHVFQDIGHGLIDNSQKQSLGSFGVVLLREICHVLRSSHQTSALTTKSTREPRALRY